MLYKARNKQTEHESKERKQAFGKKNLSNYKEDFKIIYTSFANVEVDLNMWKRAIEILKQKKVYQGQNGNITISLSTLAFQKTYYVLRNMLSFNIFHLIWFFFTVWYVTNAILMRVQQYHIINSVEFTTCKCSYTQFVYIATSLVNYTKKY